MNAPAEHTTEGLSAAIVEEARRLGFQLVGITDAGAPETFDHFCEWLDSGYDGQMGYMSRRRDAYQHTDHVLGGSASLVMLGMVYRDQAESSLGIAEPQPTARVPARVARYATGSRDYHDVIRDRLSQLADFVHQRLPGCRTRGIVDTAPLLERDFARQAGLGWFGKNTLLIDRDNGSWFFLAALLLDTPLASDPPHATDHCGTCTACLDACPTDAFPEPYVLDATRCVSYLTIELRDEPIPVELRSGLGNWVFGCDICQEVCPWNRDVPASIEPGFSPFPMLADADAAELLQCDPEQFDHLLGQTPLERPGRPGVVRNAAIVAGNAGLPVAIAPLVALLDDDNSLVRGAAAWALGQLASRQPDDSEEPGVQAALRQRRSIETMESVKLEIDAALLVVERGGGTDE